MRWQRDLILPGLVVVGEMVWIAIIVRLIATAQSLRPPGFESLLVVALAGAWGTRVFVARDWQDRRMRLFGTVGGVIACLAGVTLISGPAWVTEIGGWLADPLFSLPSPIYAFIACGVAWWRGIRIGDKTLDNVSVAQEFEMGGIGLVLAALATPVVAMGRDVPPVGELPGSAIVFFAANLSALAIARLRLLRQTGSATAGTTERWTVTLLITIGAIVALAVVLVAVLPGPLGGLASLMAPLLPLLRYLDPIFYFLLLPIALILERLLLFAAGLSMALSRMWQQILGLQPNENAEQPERILPEALPDEVIRTTEWLIVLGILLVAGLIIWRVMRRRRRAAEEAFTEERESVWSWREFLAALRAWWARRFGRQAAAPVVAASAVSETAEARTVREIYRTFLIGAAEAGMPRPPGLTPYEFVRQHALPGEAESLTEIYVRVRYGADAPDDADVAAARADWQAVRIALAARPNGGTSRGRPPST